MKSVADYTLIEPIGLGNHGNFWRARPPARLASVNDEYVSVKVLESQASERDFTRMANELRLYAKVDSEFIAPIVDAGHQDGRLFYTTQFFAEGSLAAPTRPLSAPEIIAIMSDACRGLHCLHEFGIAHRDIKPANIMLETNEARSLRGVIADLGLAQVINPGQTVTGIGPVGTIEFLAPEIIRGDVASRASDIWSVGVTLHRSLTGTSVYEDLPDESLLHALRHIIAVRPTIDSSLPEDQQSLIERCLAENPEDRFATAEELADALEELAAP